MEVVNLVLGGKGYYSVVYEQKTPKNAKFHVIAVFYITLTPLIIPHRQSMKLTTKIQT
jgi:hypothetical protein